MGSNIAPGKHSLVTVTTPLQNLLRCPIILGVIPSDMPPSCFLGSNLIDQDTAFVYTSLTNKVEYLIKKGMASIPAP